VPVRVDSPPTSKRTWTVCGSSVGPPTRSSWRGTMPLCECRAEAGKKEYNIPMYVNAWLQQPNHPWPGVYPSGGGAPGA